MTHTPPEVVVAGGGIAALEFVLALREHAGDLVRITVVAPDRELLLRPLLVAEPLAGAPLPRPALQAIADDVGFELVRGSVAAVDARRRRVALRAGGTLAYDALVLAPGVRRLPAFDGALHLGDHEGARGLAALRDDIERGEVSSVAFVAPTLTGWLLPLYEAALLTARVDDRVRVAVVTSEEEPLALFGTQSSASVAAALRAAGVEFVGGRQPTVSEGAVVLPGTSPATIPVDRIVSLPLVRGPRIEGVPEAGLYGLIPVDGYGRVDALPGVYAVGDATSFPIKQGALACQQADAAAQHVAARCGAPVTPVAFTPALRASLITGDGDPIVLGHGDEFTTLGKLPGRYLAPYVASADVSVR